MAWGAILKRKPLVFCVRLGFIHLHMTLVTRCFLMCAGQGKSCRCVVESNILLPARKFVAAIAGCVELPPVLVLVASLAISLQPHVGFIQILG